MANASRQRHYRHHRGSGQPRRTDGEDNSARAPGPTLKESVPPVPGDCLLSQGRQELREDLVKLLERAKGGRADLAKDAAVSQELSKSAQERLALACIGVSSSTQEDVELMSKVVFALFNNELVKLPPASSSNFSLVEAICVYFTKAFKSFDPQRNAIPNSTLGTPNTTSTQTETIQRSQVDILRALSAVLFENGAMVNDAFSDLIDILLGACSSPRGQEQSELRRMALNCLANLVHKTGSLYSTYHNRIYDLLLSNLTTTSYYEVGTMVSLSSTVRRKDRASERKEDKALSTRSMPPLVDVICRFMFFTSDNTTGHLAATPSSSAFSIGVIKRSSYATPTSSIATSTSTGPLSGPPQVLDIYGDPALSIRRSIQSSDSEYSDSESGVHQAQRMQHDGKVRLNALLCLQAIARAVPKQLQPHWPKFLTTSASPPTALVTYKTPSLLSLMGSDPIPTVRTAACIVLSNILESSKQYLAMAEEKSQLSGMKSHAGILTLSEKVGLMTRELHVGVAAAMNNVDSTIDQAVVIQMIKCATSIVANCTYEKMRRGLALTIFSSIRRFLDSDEPGLQAATLLFTTALLSNTIAQTDLRETILLSSQNETTTPNLLSQLMDLIGGSDIPIPVRVEAWNTLSAIARHHFVVIQSSWPRFDTALAIEQDADDSRVRTAGLLFLGEFAKSGSGASSPSTSDWWKDTLERHILKLFSEDSPSFKALGCDFISHISADAFNGLPNRLEVLIMSLILGTAMDENATARAAACRAIGMFILFPSLREDCTLIVDMANTVLDLCRDPNLNVRVRASWAVGNLSDSLVLLKSNGQDDVLEEALTLSLWTKIMRTALAVCQDNEKLKSNGIRAVGGLLRVTFEGILERERHSLVKEAVYALIKHMEQGSLKGRWNACYAMQNALLNPDFPIGSTAGTSYALDSDMVSWTKDVYGALLQAIQQSKNFKVRINACAALAVPKTRAKFGDQALFRNIVQVLMNAVQNLDNEQGQHEFGEFQYRGQLETKLLRCLDHLLQVSGGLSKLGLELDPTLRQRILASRTVVAPPIDSIQEVTNKVETLVL
ncbi:HEAT repeat-containing protein 6 [Mortierella hygrophila]|uniref:HEAT repeat-containing protein 6 n=1 Tax=Mortierella hygrophila TaxID=979708 RepID=A0A9P6EWM7_9FUNG|nr:HEAT repeat-containing protein 6 [Mortierella hygrophila]